MLGIVLAASVLYTPTPINDRVTEENSISTIMDLVFGFTPDVCIVKAKQFQAALPWAGRMSVKDRQAYLRSRENFCVEDLKIRFGVYSSS